MQIGKILTCPPYDSPVTDSYSTDVVPLPTNGLLLFLHAAPTSRTAFAGERALHDGFGQTVASVGHGGFLSQPLGLRGHFRSGIPRLTRMAS